MSHRDSLIKKNKELKKPMDIMNVGFVGAAGAAGGAAGGWTELGRTTLGSNNTDIDVTSLPDKRYYMVLRSTVGRSSSVTDNGGYRFNGDSGSNYAVRRNTAGASDSTNVNFSSINLWDTNNDPMFNISYISNLSGNEKLVYTHFVHPISSGAGQAPHRGEQVGKWSNTSAAISRINLETLGSESWLSGGEVVVLGWDPADTHTTNFWEELASVELGSAGDTLDTGTFTAKKYLWVQIYTKNVGTNNHAIRYNGDTGSNYSFRRNLDGTSEGTDINTSSDPTISMSSLGGFPLFANIFIVNNASNEKLTIAHTIFQNTAGAGNAPKRREGVAKWANTSDQITQITSTNSDSGSYDTGSIIKVWGSN